MSTGGARKHDANHSEGSDPNATASQQQESGSVRIRIRDANRSHRRKNEKHRQAKLEPPKFRCILVFVVRGHHRQFPSLAVATAIFLPQRWHEPGTPKHTPIFPKGEVGSLWEKG